MKNEKKNPTPTCLNVTRACLRAGDLLIHMLPSQAIFWLKSVGGMHFSVVVVVVVVITFGVFSVIWAKFIRSIHSHDIVLYSLIFFEPIVFTGEPGWVPVGHLKWIWAKLFSLNNIVVMQSRPIHSKCLLFSLIHAEEQDSSHKARKRTTIQNEVKSVWLAFFFVIAFKPSFYQLPLVTFFSNFLSLCI